MKISRLALSLGVTILLLLQLGLNIFRDKEGYSIKKDLVYKTIDSVQLKGDIYQPDSPGLKPAVIVVHGGGWTARTGDMTGICKQLVRSGFVVFNITYRLAPTSLYPKAVEDVRDAVIWLKNNSANFQIDSAKISGWGYSAGAHLILLVGLDPALGLRALVAGGTPADFEAWPHSPMILEFIGTTFQQSPEIWREASPVSHVRAESPPVFLYHGQWDKLVSVEQLDKMAAALHRKGVLVESYKASMLGHVTTYLLSQKSIDLGIGFIKKQISPK